MTAPKSEPMSEPKTHSEAPQLEIARIGGFVVMTMTPFEYDRLMDRVNAHDAYRRTAESDLGDIARAALAKAEGAEAMSEPTAAAMRAARNCKAKQVSEAWHTSVYDIAAIIDRETGLPELLAAAKDHLPSEYSGEPSRLRAAIARVEKGAA